MGECLSLCQREERNFQEEETQDGKGTITPKRTKKNKTRIPQAVLSSDEEDEDIPIVKHISNTIDQDPKKSINLMNNMEKESDEIIQKIKKAKKNWEYLIDKLIQKRINILREIVKKGKIENQSNSDSEEDEKIEDIIIKEKNYFKSDDKNNKIEKENNLSDEETNENKENKKQNLDIK